MKRIALAAAGLLLLAGAAVAQLAPGAIKISSLVGSFFLDIGTVGPMSAKLPLNGGTFTCASSAATIANTNVDAGSLLAMTMKTVGGTFTAPPFIATITPGTGFTVTCGASDTSTYNYLIIG